MTYSETLAVSPWLNALVGTSQALAEALHHSCGVEPSGPNAKDIITILEQGSLVLERQTSDRRDLQVDWRLLGLFWRLRRTWTRRHRVVRVGRGHRRRCEAAQDPSSFQKEEKMAAPIPAQTAGAAPGSNGRGCLQGQLPFSLQPGGCSQGGAQKPDRKEAGLPDEFGCRAAQARNHSGFFGAVRKGTNDDGTPIEATREPPQEHVKRAMKDKADVQAAFFGLVVDIEGAHNLVPVREEDWRHQCCRVG